jgi:monoamine oxidase
MDKMGEEIPADAPWDAPHAQEWDAMTFKEFLDRNTWTETARDFATVFITM